MDKNKKDIQTRWNNPAGVKALTMLLIMLAATLWAIPIQVGAAANSYYEAKQNLNNSIDLKNKLIGFSNLYSGAPSSGNSGDGWVQSSEHAITSKYPEITEYKKAVRKFVKSVDDFSETNDKLKNNASPQLVLEHKNESIDIITKCEKVRSSLDGITELLERLISEGRTSQKILDRHLDFVEKFEVESQELLEAINIYEGNRGNGLSSLQDVTLEPSLEELEEISRVIDHNSTSKTVYPQELTHRTSDLSPPEPRLNGTVDSNVLTTSSSTSFDTSYSKSFNISEIKHLAWSLDNDPVQMFYYVRNNVDYEPYFGPMAGPEWTLKQMGGNSFDQATLLIAMYRESGIPARYVYGTIELQPEEAANWLRMKNATQAADMLATCGVPTSLVLSGGEVVSIRVEHAWVEAYLPYEDFRGQKRSETGYDWIPLDPSFKTYNFIEGMESPVNSSWSSDFLNTTLNSSTYNEGWITGINETLVTSEFENYFNQTFEDIEANPELSNRSTMQLYGYWKLNEDKSNLLPSSLPHKILSTLGAYSEIPEEFYHNIRFKISSIDYKVNSSEVAGKRVTLSFIPASEADKQLIEDAGGILNVTPHLVEMKPELRIDGKSVAIGSAITLGETITFTTEFTNNYSPYYSNTVNTLTVGAYYAVVFDMGKLPLRLLEEQTSNFNMTNYRLSLNESVKKDELVGQMLYVNGLTYFYEHDFVSETSSLPDQLRWYRSTPGQLITSIDLDVWTDWLGNPVDLGAGGISIDFDRNVLYIHDDINFTKSFMLSTGVIGSTLEHEVLEQSYNVTSVSTMKVLHEANNQSIPIHTINQTNINEILPLLKISDEIKNRIENAVNLNNYEVTVPEEEVQIRDWEGIGWAVIDPKTGSGSYHISDGISGIINGAEFAEKVFNFLNDIKSFLNALALITQDRALGVVSWIVNTVTTLIDAFEVWLNDKEAGTVLLYWASMMSLIGLLAFLGSYAALIAFLVGFYLSVGYILLKYVLTDLKDAIERRQSLIEDLANLSDNTLKKLKNSAYANNIRIEAENSDNLAANGLDWLNDHQAPEGYWGYVSNTKHTSMAVLALSKSGYDTADAVDFLLDKQKSDGSFGTLKTTCFALWALSSAGIENDNATNFILNAQETDGSWDGVINTSLATIALSKSEVNITYNSTELLLNAQNTDGGWGTPSQTFDTALALKALSVSGLSIENNENKKGLVWLSQHQSPDGGWVYEDSSALAMDVLMLNSSWNSTTAVEWLTSRENPDGGYGIDRSQTYVTALAVYSLSKVDISLTISGTQWLLDNQNPDGGWGFSREYSSGFLRDTALAGEVIKSDIAADWILSLQKEDGSWGDVDHTSRAIIFLDYMGYGAGNATTWLLDNQNPDGGWGLTGNYTSGVWETALAVKALSTKYYWTTEILDGLNWLVYKQKLDGSWGINSEDPYITSVVIDSFLSAGVSPSQSQLQISSWWLKNQTLNNTSEIAMRLLVLEKMEALEPEMEEEGTQWLLDNRNIDGGWGPFKGEPSTPYHTALAFKILGIPVQDCGDVNCDTVVDISDVIKLLYYVGYPGQYELCSEWAGDVTGDGSIDISDVIRLLYYVGYPGQYTLECKT